VKHFNGTCWKAIEAIEPSDMSDNSENTGVELANIKEHDGAMSSFQRGFGTGASIHAQATPQTISTKIYNTGADQYS
jgi:hypothetical protein